MELRINEILKEKGLKMSDLANRIGMDQSNLQKSLKGNPTLERLQEVASALDVQIYELLTRKVTSSPIGTATINGKTYALVESPSIAKVPAYTDYGKLRKDIEGFVKTLKAGEIASMMGWVESFEVFTLAYTPYEKLFLLSLCYGEGEVLTIRYDVEEFSNGKDVDLAGLIQEIINDVEGAVSLKKEKDAESLINLYSKTSKSKR